MGVMSTIGIHKLMDVHYGKIGNNCPITNNLHDPSQKHTKVYT
jgi:hypothetical protein